MKRGLPLRVANIARQEAQAIARLVIAMKNSQAYSSQALQSLTVISVNGANAVVQIAGVQTTIQLTDNLYTNSGKIINVVDGKQAI